LVVGEANGWDGVNVGVLLEGTFERLVGKGEFLNEPPLRVTPKGVHPPGERVPR